MTTWRGARKKSAAANRREGERSSIEIVRASAYRQYQPFRDGAYVCRGKSEYGFDSTLIRLEASSGHVGWGEMAPLGAFYSQAFAAGAREGVALLLPKLIGADPRHLSVLLGKLDSAVHGHPYIKAPIDMALWDLLGQFISLPMAVLLGGRQTASTPLYRSISQDTPENMADTAYRLTMEGYRRLQVKVGGDPGEDVARLRLVRERVGPHVEIYADANGAWTVDRALRFTNALKDIPYHLEQPCMGFTECLSVRKAATSPLILDESIESLEDLLKAITTRACDGITLKISRIGGITNTRLLRDVAVEAGLGVTVEDTGGSDINTAATAHLMCSTPAKYQQHTVDFMNWVTVRNAIGMPETSDGQLFLPEGSGLGVRVIEDTLEAPFVDAS